MGYAERKKLLTHVVQQHTDMAKLLGNLYLQQRDILIVL